MSSWVKTANFLKGIFVLVLPVIVVSILIYHYMYLQWSYVVRRGFWEFALLPSLLMVVVAGGSLCCLDTALAVIHKDHFDKWIKDKSATVDLSIRKEYIDQLDEDLRKHRSIVDSTTQTPEARKEYFGSFLLFLISTVDTLTTLIFIVGLNGSVHKWTASKGWLLHKRWPLPGADGFTIVGMGLTILIFMNIMPNKLGLRFPVDCLKKLGWILRYAERFNIIDLGLGVFVRPIDSLLDAIGLKARE